MVSENNNLAEIVSLYFLIPFLFFSVVGFGHRKTNGGFGGNQHKIDFFLWNSADVSFTAIHPIVKFYGP